MNCQNNYSALRVDVNRFVQTSIRDIISVGDITKCMDFYQTDAFDVKYSYNDLRHTKKILQIIINVYNNYELYRFIPLKFLSDERNSMSSALENIYTYDDKNHVWMCVNRPQESDVADALFNYILCFVSLSMEDNATRNGNVINHCPLCDSDIPAGVNDCKVCDASVTDVRYYSMNAKVRKMKGNDVNRENLKVDENNVEDRFGDNLTAKNKMEENHEETMENVGNDLGLMTEEFEMNDRRTDYNKWKCTQCELLNSYDTPVCVVCFSSMEERGVWFCGRCSFENQFVHSKCDTCLMPNGNLVVKYCELCQRRKIDINRTFCDECAILCTVNTRNGCWQCRYKRCGEWTSISEVYCQRCQIWRYAAFSSLKRGDTVQMLRNNSEVDVWICSVCHTFNDANTFSCSAWYCWQKRYECMHCYECNYTSDGKSNVCIKCNQLLQPSNDHLISTSYTPSLWWGYTSLR